jgi:hypothetical protein
MLNGALRLGHGLVETLELQIHPTLQRQQMRMKFGRHHRDPLSVGLQGLMQEPVPLCSLPGTIGAALM